MKLKKGYLIIGAVVFLFIGTILVMALPPEEKWAVSFDTTASLTYAQAIVDIENLQDGNDDFSFKLILNQTTLDLPKVTLMVEEWKSRNYQITDYTTVCEPYEEITENSTVIEYPNCEQVASGSHIETEWFWDELTLVNRNEDGEKGELRNHMEEIHFKKGEIKRYRVTYYFNELLRQSSGFIYLDINGEQFYDFEESSWWDSDYDYCVDITTDQSYNDHRYLVYLNDEDFDYGHAQAGGEDYRVVNASCGDDGIEMDIWLENITSTNSTFWFKGDNETNTDYALYYGYAAASSVSDGKKTFGNFIDNTTLAGWTLNGCTVTVDAPDNTYLKIACTGGGVRDAYRTENTPYGVYAIEWQFYQLSGGPDDFPVFTIVDGNFNIPFIRLLAPRAHDQTIWSWGWGAAGTLDWVENADRIMKFIINESDTTAGMSYYLQYPNRVTINSVENVGGTDGGPTDADLIWINQQNRPSGITFKQRWIFWRPYVSPEPTVAIGTEEIQPLPPQFAPEWFNNLTNIASPATYSTDNYGFQVNWTDDNDANGYNFSYFEHNFTGVMTNYSTTRNENISYYNQTEGIPAGSYVFRFYANDSGNEWNATDEWIFIVNRFSPTVNLLLNGTDGNKVYNRSDTANFTVIIDVAGFVVNLNSNYTGFETQSGITPLVNYTILDRIGTGWNLTGYYDGNQNYSESFETHYFDVILPPTPEPEFGISIALIEERRTGWWGWLWNRYEDVLRFGFIIGNLKMGGYNITDGGFVLMNNTFIPAYIFHHVNTSITVDTGGLWYNVTFNESCDVKEGINHTHDGATNDTFTILDDGVYRITYVMSFQDSAPSPNAHIVSRIVVNEIEVDGSLLEADSSKQYSDLLVSHTGALVQLYIDDEIQFQFTSDDTTVALDSHITFGVHKDSAVVSFERIA